MVKCLGWDSGHAQKSYLFVPVIDYAKTQHSIEYSPKTIGPFQLQRNFNVHSTVVCRFFARPSFSLVYSYEFTNFCSIVASTPLGSCCRSVAGNLYVQGHPSVVEERVDNQQTLGSIRSVVRSVGFPFALGFVSSNGTSLEVIL